MRGCELKGLRWKDVDLFEAALTVQKAEHEDERGKPGDSAKSNCRADLAELKDRSDKLGSSEPQHYVFRACECGVIDPTKPHEGLAFSVAFANPGSRVEGASLPRSEASSHHGAMRSRTFGHDDHGDCWKRVQRDVAAQFPYSASGKKGRRGYAGSDPADGFNSCRKQPKLSWFWVGYSTNHSTKRLSLVMQDLEVIENIGTPGRIRTCDPLLRRQVLYPLSYGRPVG